MKRNKLPLLLVIVISVVFGCRNKEINKETILVSPDIKYISYTPSESDLIISRNEYQDKLYGFWLAQSIANWTGLVTEMDKIGNIGEIKTGDFYTRKDWGKPDKPSIWGEGIPSALSPTIDLFLKILLEFGVLMMTQILNTFINNYFMKIKLQCSILNRSKKDG